jgi:antitoxin component YwqK of YwqJK toxin-antitoxin module
MESPVWSRANQRCVVLFLAMLGLAGPGCSAIFPSPQSVEQSDPSVKMLSGVLMYGEAPLTGVLMERDGQQLYRQTPFRNGLRHGLARAFYPDGRLAYERQFRNGNREGTHKGYWPSGQPQFVYRYEKDLFEGEQVGYYKTGQRAELRHYRRGQEEGTQQIWDGEGRLTSNYTVKEGRRYGLVGRFDCVSVH